MARPLSGAHADLRSGGSGNGPRWSPRRRASCRCNAEAPWNPARGAASTSPSKDTPRGHVSRPPSPPPPAPRFCFLSEPPPSPSSCDERGRLGGFNKALLPCVPGLRVPWREHRSRSSLVPASRLPSSPQTTSSAGTRGALRAPLWAPASP